MTNIQEQVDQLRHKERKRETGSDKEQEEFRRKMEEVRRWKETKLMPHLYNATPHDYEEWLRGYLERGGKVSHTYNYDLPPDWYIAATDFTLKPLYGATAVNIIVPANVKVEIEGTGHCGLYFMDGFHQRGNGVPLYKNTLP